LLKADEVFDKFPKIFHHISDDMKAKLLKFLETKVYIMGVIEANLPHINCIFISNEQDITHDQI